MVDHELGDGKVSDGIRQSTEPANVADVDDHEYVDIGECRRPSTRSILDSCIQQEVE
jgi:hypothetical protein